MGTTLRMAHNIANLNSTCSNVYDANKDKPGLYLITSAAQLK